SVFQFLAVILVMQSLGALFAALRFARYSLKAQPLRHHRHQPKAVVIIPCKGLETGLEENIEAFCAQDYREYEVILVTESKHDPAYRILSRIVKQSRRSAWLVVAGQAENRGQKIHNLIAALETLNAVDRRADILVFADSDARPSRAWLAELVAPLDEKRVGATTGFRWHLPHPEQSTASGVNGLAGRFSSILLSVWNSSALTLLGERSSFAWGGATAIRRDNFDNLGVRERWNEALSDDYVLTSVVQEAGQRIKFVPAALMPTPSEASFAGLIEFTTRQMKVTRVYAPGVWRVALVSQMLFNVTLWGGLAWLVISSLRGRGSLLLAGLLAAILVLGAASSWVRVVVAARLMKTQRRQILSQRWVYPALAPLSSLLYLGNLLASAWSRRIIWRGIGYEMLSPSETRIWLRPEVSESAEPIPPSSPRRPASARSTRP
ncbi:MAG: glycosyltransferase, partial [Acidobacteriota bacterium]